MCICIQIQKIAIIISHMLVSEWVARYYTNSLKLAVLKHLLRSLSKWEKIRWAKLSRFLRFLRVPRKFSCEFLTIGKQ